MKPIVGIVADFVPSDDPRTRGKIELNWNYAQCVQDAGGSPVVLPPQADPSGVLPWLDGILIPGGNDLDPSLWNEALHPQSKLIAEERFAFERRLLTDASPEMPVLGICYGCQLINVLRGGSLIQHLPDEIGHDLNSGGTLQTYRISKESRLASLLGETTVSGKSYHHQSIRRPGENLEVAATGEDGVVEAIEATDRPWLIGVQWHPERTSEDQTTMRLFHAFIAACEAYRGSRSHQGGP
jgi:putative glutamine amidotransferase